MQSALTRQGTTGPEYSRPVVTSKARESPVANIENNTAGTAHSRVEHDTLSLIRQFFSQITQKIS